MREKIQVYYREDVGHKEPDHKVYDLKPALSIMDRSVVSLFLWQVPDYCTDQELVVLLNKVCKEGKVHIYGLDIYDINRQLHTGSLSLEEYKKIIFGENKKNIHSMMSISKLLSQLGFKIESRELKNRQYHITAIKQ